MGSCVKQQYCIGLSILMLPLSYCYLKSTRFFWLLSYNYAICVYFTRNHCYSYNFVIEEMDRYGLPKAQGLVKMGLHMQPMLQFIITLYIIKIKLSIFINCTLLKSNSLQILELFYFLMKGINALTHNSRCIRHSCT